MTCGANAADPWPTSSRGGARALGEQRAEALANGRSRRARGASRPRRRSAATARRAGRARRTPSPTRSCRRPRSCRGRARRSAAGLEDGVRVGDAAQRAEREDVLVLDAGLLPAGPLVDVLAADRARGAAVAGDAARLGEVLGGQARGVGERRGLEVAGRERGDRVEGEQVRERAELAVLRRRRAERALPQVAGSGEDRLRIGGRDLRPRTHGDRLEELRAEHRAEPAAARVTAVVRDRRVLDEVLARRADRGDSPGLAESLAQPLLGLVGGQAPEVAGRLEARAVAVDEQDRRLRAGAAHDDRVVARQLAGDREVARGERIVEQAGRAETSRRRRTSRSWSAACRRGARSRTRAAPRARAGRHRAGRARA